MLECPQRIGRNRSLGWVVLTPIDKYFAWPQRLRHAGDGEIGTGLLELLGEHPGVVVHTVRRPPFWRDPAVELHSFGPTCLGDQVDPVLTHPVPEFQRDLTALGDGGRITGI